MTSFGNGELTGKHNRGGECRAGKSTPFLHTYIAAIPDRGEVGTLSSAERMEEISATKNPRVRLEKYYVFKLLEHALSHSLGIDARDVDFRRGARGGWECDVCKFSLSHSRGAVAVSISDREVGVDIEPLSPAGAQRYAEKILTPAEYDEYMRCPEDRRCELFLSVWCRKESIFKSGLAPDSTVGGIETGNYPTKAEAVQINGVNYILSVCSHNMELLEIFNCDFALN